MSYKKFKLNLSLYLDGKLKPAENKKIKNHLKSCRECSDLYLNLLSSKTSLGVLEKAKACDNFESKVMAKISSTDGMHGFSHAFLRATKASIFSAALIFIAISAFSYFTTSDVKRKTDNIASINNYVLKDANSYDKITNVFIK